MLHSMKPAKLSLKKGLQLQRRMFDQKLKVSENLSKQRNGEDLSSNPTCAFVFLRPLHTSNHFTVLILLQSANSGQ